MNYYRLNGKRIKSLNDLHNTWENSEYVFTKVQRDLVLLGTYQTFYNNIDNLTKCLGYNERCGNTLLIGFSAYNSELGYKDFLIKVCSCGSISNKDCMTYSKITRDKG
ncbi:hypothetical protein [Pseudobacteroides cellulosolvens]|uniref:Uncharacterized protein n=1 Tax=Pseudobacteroides cellulosolvens ATCC 35603 = DSM 2933 TaxID=398512 RepID=A0A0L6JPI2_9FIRM|nr:hypothetical protein [Pseudobacteroides cellulosolvens]KNY27625.1 hypothetical protein Bccel_2896 [Pseudobacteroides cellulosolvens ATCC 35603 = DSM 2933]